MEEASEELITSDKQVSNLRTKLFKAQQEISKLQQELKRERIKRNSSLPNDFLPNPPYLQCALYSLIAVLFTLWLTNNLKTKKIE